MRTFLCRCGNTLFFENTRCVACGSDAGWCPGCRQMTALQPLGPGHFRCGQDACRATLVKCPNFAVENVCNRCLVVTASPTSTAELCDCCRYNATIPDLSVPGNRDKWYRLEAAKRRMLYSLDNLGLPYGAAEDGISPPLSFDFKADTVTQTPWWQAVNIDQVPTGHQGGKITINIREADSIERERERVISNEPQRTIIGHFRHEFGHYYWLMLVAGNCENECSAVFGDHRGVAYSGALDRYYRFGPPDDWHQRFISAYATMHPWEDFAETFAAYLSMIEVCDTARYQGFLDGLDVNAADLDALLNHFRPLGLALNELNRCMGLIDLLPEYFSPVVIDKLGFVQRLIRTATSGTPIVNVLRGTPKG